jgi:F-type H+-transporting ATPase subunit delta
MSVTAVARRYAEAIADVAIAHDLVDPIDSDLRAFVGMMSESRELYHVFASPVISMDEKERVLDAIIERARPNRMSANLFKTLLRHYRLHNLDAVYEQFRRQMNERRGLILAEVTTASPLEPGDRAALVGRLQEMMGRQVRDRPVPDRGGGDADRVGHLRRLGPDAARSGEEPPEAGAGGPGLRRGGPEADRKLI